MEDTLSPMVFSAAGRLLVTVMAKGRLAYVLAIVATVCSSTSALAQASDIENDESQLGPVFMLSLGGRLYDNVWPILELLPPEKRNPAFPDFSSSDSDTWRCVSCHGWDYDGAGGERARNAPSANAASLAPLKSTDPSIIIEKIVEPTHPFPGDALPDLALFLLALFISEGQYDRDSIFDRNGRALGDPVGGRGIYEGACINCHEIDGRAFMKGEIGDRSSLGWIARNRPEQALHRILNGVPLAEMLSLRFLSTRAIADLLAYVQTIDPSSR